MFATRPEQICEVFVTHTQGHPDMPAVHHMEATEASEQTKKKVQAAKSYIENMYQRKHQFVQGRIDRWVLTHGRFQILQPGGENPLPMPRE
eukprot:scaffold263215_cov39-Prasinocladus_malaysianus.AAC.2